MSKYVKELMMDQLRTDLGGSTVAADPGPEGAGRGRGAPVPPRPAQEDDPGPGAEEHAGPAGVHRHGDRRASRYLEGPSAWPSGVATASPSWPRRSRTQVKTLKKPADQGGAVDGVVIGPDQVEDITKLPSREALIGRVVSLALAPVQRVIALANAPAGGLMGQLKTMSEGAPGAEGAPKRRPRRRATEGRRRKARPRPHPAVTDTESSRQGASDTHSGCHSFSSSVPVRLTHAPEMIMI